MASLDKDKKRRLKEADDAYKKYAKAFKNGKISKEELKDKLRPYRFELRELGYNVKIKEDSEQPPQPDTGAAQVVTPETLEATEVQVSYQPWRKRSSLTIEEIESRVDILTLSSNPSEALKKRYQQRYGEDLSPPLDLVRFEAPPGQAQQAMAGGLPAQSTEPAPAEEGERRPFWKGLLKKRAK